MATTKKPFGASGTCPSPKKTFARGFLLLVIITSSALYGFWPRSLSTHKERSWTQEMKGDFNLNLGISRIPSVWVICLVSGDKIAVFASWTCPGECMKKISVVKEVSAVHLCLVMQPMSTSPVTPRQAVHMADFCWWLYWRHCICLWVYSLSGCALHEMSSFLVLFQ